MPLGPGVRLGPYEIVAALGAGGMGEVYKAKDTRLDRVVAIKVLPSYVSDDHSLRDSSAGFQARAQHAVSDDGRFLMNFAADDPSGSPITVVLNWDVALKQ